MAAQQKSKVRKFLDTIPKANGLDPYAYLRRVFVDLPVAIAAKDDLAINRLLPWNVANAGALADEHCWWHAQF